MFQNSSTVYRVFDEISVRENFAKLATKRFSCFTKMRNEFRETAEITKETSFAKHENRENEEYLKYKLKI